MENFVILSHLLGLFFSNASIIFVYPNLPRRPPSPLASPHPPRCARGLPPQAGEDLKQIFSP